MSFQIRRLLPLAGLLAATVLMAHGLAPYVHADNDDYDDIDAQPAAAPAASGGLFALSVAAVAPGRNDNDYRSSLRIWTDSNYYGQGDPISISYRVPGRGRFELIDYPSGGSRSVISSGYDDGQGDTWWGYVTPPAGHECVRIRWWGSEGQSRSRKTCFSSHY